MPGCVNVCVALGDADHSVGPVPLSKSQRNCAFWPFATPATNVTSLPVAAGAGGDTSCTCSGAGSVTDHRNDCVAAFKPSLAAMTTLKLPVVEGVPLMRPLAASIDTPGGKPTAPKPSSSPFGSLATSCRSAATLMVVVCVPGLASVGVTAGFK